MNRAARVQHLAGPREAVIAESLGYAVPEGAALEIVESFEANVKGIEEPLRLKRLRPRSR